jgi:hypothetical protein
MRAGQGHVIRFPQRILVGDWAMTTPLEEAHRGTERTRIIDRQSLRAVTGSNDSRQQQKRCDGDQSCSPHVGNR